MVQKRAVLCGYYGKGNGGDEALLAALLQMLPENIEPLVLSGNPGQTQTSYQVEACDRMSPFQVLQAMQKADLFIWGGGSLIQDATSAASPLYYSGLMGLAQQRKIPTVAWAQGIGPLNRRSTQILAKNCFTGCRAVSVRDEGSANILKNWSIPYTIAPDPVWALEETIVGGMWNLPNPRIAVTLRVHPDLTPLRVSHLTKALQIFQEATNSFILLIPFQPEQDRAIAEYIHRYLPEHSQIFNLDDPRMLKGIFQGVEMAIGMRYHSLIMAAGAECRCFALSYDPKVSQLMADLHIPGWELAKIPEDPQEIAKSWLDCYENHQPLTETTIDELREKARLHQKLLFELVSNL